MFRSRLPLLAFLLMAAPMLVAKQRVMPPDALACDRNELTSFSGMIQNYERQARTLSMYMASDDGTEERFELSLNAGEQWPDRFLIDGDAFTEAAWERIEKGPGRLKPGMRAIVWLCLDDATMPVIDWRPPPEVGS